MVVTRVALQNAKEKTRRRALVGFFNSVSYSHFTFGLLASDCLVLSIIDTQTAMVTLDPG